VQNVFAPVMNLTQPETLIRSLLERHRRVGGEPQVVGPPVALPPGEVVALAHQRGGRR
jgi:hypothetical protein